VLTTDRAAGGRSLGIERVACCAHVGGGGASLESGAYFCWVLFFFFVSEQTVRCTCDPRVQAQENCFERSQFGFQGRRYGGSSFVLTLGHTRSGLISVHPTTHAIRLLILKQGLIVDEPYNNSHVQELHGKRRHFVSRDDAPFSASAGHSSGVRGYVR
jgi:hypothetical protein